MASCFRGAEFAFWETPTGSLPLMNNNTKEYVSNILSIVLFHLKYDGRQTFLFLLQILEDNGSWGNESIIQYYKHYADVAFGQFGHLVSSVVSSDVISFDTTRVWKKC